MNIDILKQAGIDYENGVNRFLGDRELYNSILAMFPDDPTMGQVRQAMEARDYPALFAAAHELKGISGNEDILPVYKAACALVELLRPGIYDDKLILESYQSLDAAYNKVASAICDARRNVNVRQVQP